ncbi:MAG: transporter substrate-binding domain-containing protein [bacterium]|nr:transporter substrate-binding domain-containing protein [bacterium]
MLQKASHPWLLIFGVFLWAMTPLTLYASVPEKNKLKSQPLVEAAYHPDIQRIVDRGELVVALADDQDPPWFFKTEEGEYIGFDIELAHAIGEELKVPVRFNQEAPTYNAVTDVIAAERADIVITDLSLTLERAKKVLFSKPYGFLQQAIVLNRLAYAQLKVKGVKKPSIIQKLNQPEAIIAVSKGTSYESWARELFPEATFYLVDDWDKVFVEKFQSGKIAAAFRADLTLRRLIGMEPSLKVYVQPILLKGKVDTIHIAIPPGKDHLLQWINDYIDKKNIRVEVNDLFRDYPDLVMREVL